MRQVKCVAHARAGLLGNPSDGYGGKAIALCIADFHAQVCIEPSDRLRLSRGLQPGRAFASIGAAIRDVGDSRYDEGVRLLRASMKRYFLAFPERAFQASASSESRFLMRYETDIPRQVGLAGSSAIVIAALRALNEWFGTDLSSQAMAQMAWSAEVEDLGFSAGPMDRIVQSEEGIVAMDLAEEGDFSSYWSLIGVELPPLFMAWDPNGGSPSSLAHDSLKKRWRSGDPIVLKAVSQFRDLVDEGLILLKKNNHDGFREAMTRNFRLRQTIFHVGQIDLEMVSIALSLGAGVKLCGSGGAVIGIPFSESDFSLLERAYRDKGYEFIRPVLKLSDSHRKSESRNQ